MREVHYRHPNLFHCFSYPVLSLMALHPHHKPLPTLIFNHFYISLYLSRTPLPYSMLNMFWWCYIPRSEAKGVVVSIPMIYTLIKSIPLRVVLPLSPTPAVLPPPLLFPIPIPVPCTHPDPYSVSVPIPVASTVNTPVPISSILPRHLYPW